MLTFGVVVFHDNARLHTAFQLGFVGQPSYNPDLTLSDCHLFTYQKNWVGSQHFNNNEELIEGV
jgi:hypothetical protein